MNASAGAGRTGDWWAVNHSNVVPDLLVFAKGVGSGMPISGVATRSELVANQVICPHKKRKQTHPQYSPVGRFTIDSGFCH